MSCQPRGSGRSDKSRRVGESSFQPVSEHDLQRFVPASGECRRIRALLRDYCDGELTSFLRSEVDEHVHGCRDCGLALSRHELEVLRLQDAYREERREIEAVPEGLTQRVVAEVARIGEGGGADRAAGLARPGDGEVKVPQGFTGRVMDRVRMEWHPSLPHERALAIMGKGLLLLPIAAVFLLAALLWSSLVPGPGASPAYRLETLVAGRVSVRAEDGRWQPFSVQRSAERAGLPSPGSALPYGSRIAVGPGGEAKLRLEDEDGVAHIRAELEANTQIQLAAELIEVDHGALAIEGSTRVEVADLCFLDLLESPDGSGVRAHLSLTEVQRPDHALATATSLRLRIEMQTGRAQILRVGRAPWTLHGGQVAEFDGWSEIRVEPALTGALLQRSRRTSLRRVPSRDPISSLTSSWLGRVSGSLSGAGLAGVEVELHSAGVQVTLTSAFDGTFSVPRSLLHGGPVVLRVRSQEHTRGYASYGPEPVELSHLQAGRLPGIDLLEDRPVSGHLRSADRGGLAATRILPVVVDELFQLVDPLEECAVETDAEGRFVLRGLPVDLKAHLRLSLLVRHDDYPARAFLELGDRDRNRLPPDLDLVLEAGRELALHGLPPGLRVEAFEAVPGLPRRAFARRRELQADARGVAEIQDGASGPFWYLDPERDQLVELAQSPGAEGFRAAIPEGPFLGGRYFWLSGSGSGEISGADSFASVVMKEGQQALAVPGARVFLRSGSARPYYLGSYDGFGGLRFGVPQSRRYALFGVSPAGGLGTLSSSLVPDPDLDGAVALQIERSGGAVLTMAARTDEQLQAGWRGSLLLRFLRMDGIFAGDSYWRLLGVRNDWRADHLLAGDYRVLGPNGQSTECRIEAGKDTRIAQLHRR